MNFTNEEIILENEIKRKDILKVKYIEPVEEELIVTTNLLGFNLVKIGKKDEI